MLSKRCENITPNPPIIRIPIPINHKRKLLRDLIFLNLFSNAKKKTQAARLIAVPAIIIK